MATRLMTTTYLRKGGKHAEAREGPRNCEEEKKEKGKQEASEEGTFGSTHWHRKRK